MLHVAALSEYLTAKVAKAAKPFELNPETQKALRPWRPLR